MSDFAKTGVYVGVAAALLAAAFLTQPRSLRSPGTFDDSGEAYFPQLEDPLQATALEIHRYDDDTGAPDVFRVEYKNNRWTVPSHHDYPADAKDRLAKTAAMVGNLSKDAVVSDNAEEHADFGVIDPTDESAGGEGRGVRIKLFDKSDNVMADLIVGRDVDDQEGFKYMRLPGTDRVYRTKADQLDLSARFADWIDTDLLEISSADLAKVTLRDYRVDLEQGRILDSGTTALAKDDQSKWIVEEMEPPLEDGKELDESKTRDLASAVTGLKIVGVREKPEGLKPDLSLPQVIQAAFRQRMAARGFFVSEDSLYSNDGEAIVETKDGLVYTLRFGGAFVGQGDEVSAGAEDETVVDAEADSEDNKEEPSSSVPRNRFLLVSVDFNEDRFPPIPDPEPEAEKEDDSKPDDEDAKSDAEDEKAEKSDEEKAEEKAAKGKAEQEKKEREEELKRQREERERKIKEGREKAEELSQRYAKWYYVISNDAFEKIRVPRAELVKDKEAAEDAEEPTVPFPQPGQPPAPPTEPATPDGEPKSEKDASKEEPAKQEKPKADDAEKESKPAEKADEPKESKNASEPKESEKAEPKEEKPAPDEAKDDNPKPAEKGDDAKEAQETEKPAEPESKPEQTEDGADSKDSKEKDESPKEEPAESTDDAE